MIDVDSIKKNIEEKLTSLGYKLFSLRYLNDKKGNILEIVVDRDENINLDDIVKVSDSLSLLLDELILDDIPYTLDVSSLGAEKPIDVNNIDKYLGKYVNIHLSHPYKGENILEGTISEISDDTITLEYKIKTRTIKALLNKKDIDRARLAIKF